MNKIDSRFLDFSFIVKGTRNEPPSNPNDRDQYIVGDSPTGDFEGHNNNLARYYRDKGWVFIPPEDCHEVYDMFTNEILYYESNSWIRRFKYFKGNASFMETQIQYITFIVNGVTEIPEYGEHGDYCFNITTKEMLYYQNNDWIKANFYPSFGTQILVLNPSNNTWMKWCFDGEKFNEISGICVGLYWVQNGNMQQDGTIVFEGEKNYLYCFDNNHLVRLYPSDTSSTASAGKEFYTETHTLTAQEVSDKSFTLSYSVESGEETNILCSVSGVIQPASVAFEVSGDTLSWNNKTLDGLLNSGDVFVVHYVKASA